MAYLPERRVGTQITVHGEPGCVEELEIHPSLEACVAELPTDVRRGSHPAGCAVMKLRYTIDLTDPAQGEIIRTKTLCGHTSDGRAPGQPNYLRTTACLLYTSPLSDA